MYMYNAFWSGVFTRSCTYTMHSGVALYIHNVGEKVYNDLIPQVQVQFHSIQQHTLYYSTFNHMLSAIQSGLAKLAKMSSNTTDKNAAVADATSPTTLAARVESIKALLLEVETAISNRTLLVAAARKDPNYHFYAPVNQTWFQSTKKDERIFNWLERQLENFDPNTTPSQKVEDWYDKAADIWTRTTHANDRVADQNKWDNYPERPGKIDPDWSWEEATGKGPGPHENVDPLDEEDGLVGEDVGKFVDAYKEEFKAFRRWK
jgi:hypothetical protein